MKVDAYIVNAIDQYILANKLTQAAFAKQLGISEATMVKWRRQGNGITGRRWQHLYRYIKRYLPAERIFIAGNGEEHYSSATEGTPTVISTPVRHPDASDLPPVTRL